MPLVNVREVRTWQKTRRPVFNEQGAVMLGAGAPLNAVLAERLAGLGFRWLYVCDREVPDEALKPALPNELRSRALRALESAFAAVGRRYRLRVEEVERRPVRSLEPARVRERYLHPPPRGEDADRVVDPDIVELSYRIGDAVIVADLPSVLPFASNRSPATWLLAHSLDVALTSAMLAHEFGYQRDEVARIVLGAMFHDVGYALFPPDWLFGAEGGADGEERPGREVLERARRLHPVLGFIVLKDLPVTGLLVAHAAYQHHEHQDGSGFPRGLKGTNRVLSREEALRTSSATIHRYADIVAVADAYDRLISAPPTGFALPAGEAAGRMRAVAGTHLNRTLVSGLLAEVPPFPLGSEVWVAEGDYVGYRGVVVRVPRRRMSRPVVRLVFDRRGERIRPVEVDTAREPERLSAEPPAGGVSAPA